MIRSKLSCEKVEPDRFGDGALTTAPGSASPARAGDERTLDLRQRSVPLWFIAFAILLTTLFIKPLFSLMTHAAHSELDSYIVLVPFISAYLIYTRRKQIPKEYDFSPWTIVPLLAGLAALTTALTVHRAGGSLSDHDYVSLMALSFVCLLTTGGFLFLGRKWMVSSAFPFFFLIFTVPMPDAMTDALETASKLASAEAANLFFNITGTPVLRDGTVFQLPNIAIEVAQECSGIRSSWVLFITSLLAANLFLNSTWRRAVLIAFVIPLGIVRNGLRVFVIGMLCVHFGPHMIHSVIHRRGGPIFFALSLIPLFLLLLWFRRGEIAQDHHRKNRSEGLPANPLT
jgi:exosortase C (VPDSG-CTERM-specific)